MRRFSGSWLAPVVVMLMGCSSAGAQSPPEKSSGTQNPTAIELIEDLRVLSILNGLSPTREQSSKLAQVATAGREGLTAIDAEVKEKFSAHRERLLAARERMLRGGVAPAATDQLLLNTGGLAQKLRAQKTESLIRELSLRLRTILTAEQAVRIEEELAPTAEQPWRGYGQLISGALGERKSGGASRMPSDPGKWLKELRDLRIDSASGDPQEEIRDFEKKLSKGLPTGSPLQQQAAAQARAFAIQVLAMPPDVFARREWELARMSSRQELSARNQQHALDGKTAEVFDPYRWLVEEVLLSPRAAVDLRDRAAAR